MQDQYLMIAGTALFIWEPLVLTIPLLIYFFIKRKLRTEYAAFSFPFVWIAMEWLYAYGELAFPWLHIGNTQTYQLEKIQFADITGVYGISFWILLINVMVYFLIHELRFQPKSPKPYYLASAIVIVYILPNFYSPDESVLAHPGEKTINVGIFQPNIDPWEKWEGAKTYSGRWAQTLYFLELIGKENNDSLDIAVLPESAILIDLPSQSTEMNIVHRILDSLNVSLISGYVRVRYYDEGSAPATSNPLIGTNIKYDSYNSIFFAEPKSTQIQTFSKMRLVPFAERIPYVEEIPFLIEPLRWGVGISNWGKGKDSTIFESASKQTKFLSMVCYESIFPEFVSTFVQNGAEFLVFITNDSWWGNTSGARQHNQYSILRAVENRRWVVRCANGGISSFTDPLGRMYDNTEMYTKAYIHRKIQPIQYQTFYTRNGDLFARICSSIAAVILLFSIGYGFLRKSNG